MSELNCVSCRKPKASLTCDLCEDSLCKKCAQILNQDTFSFLESLPEVLTHHTYCGVCFDQNVAPELDAYQEAMEAAKNVFVFFKTQRKDIPLIKKSKDTFQVMNCEDRDEMILRLAFFSVKAGYNGLIEVEVSSEKLHPGGSYQTSQWRGIGTAAMIDASKIERLDLLDQMYR
jgi:hypothetical protein